MGGLFGGAPDTSAAEESLAMQRKQMADAESKALEDKRNLEEQMSARRRSRVGSRALLSESRLNPETGIETLGTDETPPTGGY
jgi:hypothetical protein